MTGEPLGAHAEGPEGGHEGAPPQGPAYASA